MIFISTVVKDGDELKTAGYLKMTRDFYALDVEEIAKEAAEEALANLGEKSIPLANIQLFYAMTQQLHYLQPLCLYSQRKMLKRISPY